MLQRRNPPLRRWLLWPLAIAACLALPRPAAAQQCTESPCPSDPPEVYIEPGTGTYATGPVYVFVQFEDAYGVNPTSRRMTFNGANVTSSFTASPGAMYQATLTLNPGVNTFSAYICDNDFRCTTQSVTWTAVASGMRVLPDGDSLHVPAGRSAVARFSVANPGGLQAGINLSASCTGVTGCTATPATLNLTPGDSAFVDVSFTAPASGTGVVTLQAMDVGSSASDAGTVNVRIGGAPDGGYPLDAQSMERIERSACVAIGLGGGAAQECGDLRLAHPLPAVTALNTARTPTLLYNHHYARPFVMVGAHVAPTAGTRPDTVRGYLTVGTTVATPRKWPGWPSDTTKRVVVGVEGGTLPTGVYDYRLDIVAEWNGSATRDTLHSRTGKMAHVNHNGSPFGAGWWLAGVERLHAQPGDSLVLWVGGDGSARIYRGTPLTGPWVVAGYDRPDTLRKVGGEYVRTLPGRAEVWFDGGGQHVRTVNRRGHRTELRWDASGRLASMVLPTPPAQTDTLRYLFEYAAAVPGCTTLTPGLARVYSPDAAGGYRTTTICADANRQVQRITDPDTRAVNFAYTAGVPGVISRRTDRRGAVSAFEYGDRRLTIARRVLAVGDTLGTSFSTGYALGYGKATAVKDFYLWMRNPLGRYTYFILGRYGAPTRIQDPVGRSTSIERGDARWPGQVTRVVEHNGFETTATYDARGNLSTATAWNPYDDGRNATTTYRWNPQWDDVTQVTAPEGEVTFFDYDALGRRAWEQPGTDAARRVSYTYHPATHPDAPGLLATVTHPGGATEQYVYDQRGNLKTVSSPMGYAATTLRDRLGRAAVTETPGGSGQLRRDSVFYDVADQVDSTVTRAGSQRLIVTNVYDEEGNLRSLTRRDPNASAIGSVTTQWVYDLAGRKTVEIAPDGMRDSTVYDRAGNPLELHTRRTDASGQRLVIRNRYDNADRLIYSYIPEVRYDARDEGLAQRGFIMPREGHTSGVQPPPYPWYPNDGGTGYLIPADTVSFNYDNYGRLRGAYNREARIRRDYYRNGALRADTLTVRTWAELGQSQAGFTHQYALRFTYDRNGRRTSLKHPGNIAPRQAGTLKDLTTYTYDRHTGALATVTDPLGTEFRYGYNARGEVETLWLPGGITERYRYDLDGRLALHTTENLSGSQDRYTPNPLRRDTLGYDAGGRMLFSRNMAGAGDTLSAQYSALGQLTLSSARSRGGELNNAVPSSTSTEAPSYDALGNQTHRTTTSTFRIGLYRSGTHSSETYRYHAGTGRLRARETPVHGDTLVYDTGGNLVWETTTTPGYTSQDHFADRAYFYDATGQLRASDTRVVDDPTSVFSTYRRSFEEYRYDALGRRVLVRARRDCYQPPYSGVCELGWIRRTVWDGDQELYEIQQPGGEQTYYSQHMENDTSHIQLAALTDEGQPIDPNTFYGRVLYTHGLSLDHPLGVIRMGYGDLVDTANAVRQYRALDPYVIIPHWNSRGQPVLGTYTDGAWRKCEWLSGYKRCNFLSWPEMWAGYARPNVTENAWHGTLLVDKGDASGLNYRRNRYYDPGTGRFTQEDPIGLAGGLNVYGFASGDPVNFSDPFGLCPIPPRSCLSRQGVSLAVGFIPLAGDAYDLFSAAVGYDYIADERLSDGDRLATAAGTFFGSGRLARQGVDAAEEGADAARHYRARGAGRLTNRQARDLAAHNGYTREVRDVPINTKGQLVFTNGQNYITVDVDSHNGGVWKVFNRDWQRIGTYDALLHERVDK